MELKQENAFKVKMISVIKVTKMVIVNNVEKKQVLKSLMEFKQASVNHANLKDVKIVQMITKYAYHVQIHIQIIMVLK